MWAGSVDGQGADARALRVGSQQVRPLMIGVTRSRTPSGTGGTTAGSSTASASWPPLTVDSSRCTKERQERKR